MTDANLLAFGAAVFFTALVGGYLYMRGSSMAYRTPQPQPVRVRDGHPSRPMARQHPR